MATLIGGAVALVIVGGLSLVALVIGLWIYRSSKGRPAGSPAVQILAPGITQKLVDSAMTGNAAALKDALLQEIEFEWANGGKQLIMGKLIAAVQRKLANPSASTWLPEIIAHFSAKTPEEIVAAVQAEFGLTADPNVVTAPAPRTTLPTAAAAAAGLLLFCASTSFAVDTWGMTVKGPQRFYEKSSSLIVDQPLKRLRDGSLAPIGDCNLPDTGPTIYVDYFYADWCKDCAESSLLADNLRSQGYDVLKRNCSTDSGAKTARIMGVKTVPYWLVMEDGRYVVSSNDSKKVTAYLNSKKASRNQVGFGPSNAQPPAGAYFQPAYAPQSNSVGFWEAGPARRFVSAPLRWRPLRRLFGRC
jgi:hypothetical protein